MTLETTQRLKLPDLYTNDLNLIQEIASLIEDGNLQAFQILRRSITKSNRDNRNIMDLPTSTGFILANAGTFMIVSDSLHSFNDTISQHGFRTPTTSLNTIKSFASYLGGYMINLLTINKEERTLKSLKGISESLTRLQKEMEFFGSSPKSWVQF